MRADLKEAIGRREIGIGVLLVALAMLPFSDLAISTRDPWAQVLKLLAGFLAPDLSGVGSLAWAVAYTVAFGLGGVFIGALSGLLLAIIHHWHFVRGLAATLRAVHELFWALLFLQVFGPSAISGALAIALPYAGVFAKVYAEMLEEADRRPDEVLPPRTHTVSRFVYARLPWHWRHSASTRSTASSVACARALCWASLACRRWALSSMPSSKLASTTRSLASCWSTICSSPRSGCGCGQRWSRSMWWAPSCCS
jgi:hypothetical protein